MPHHLPVKSKRLFRPRKTYGKIKWTDFRIVIREFKRRMDSWYFKPAAAVSAVPDAAFAEMALTCLLIDALSQYRYGAQQSPTEHAVHCNKPLEASRYKFKDFLAERVPALAVNLPIPIKTGEIKNGAPVELKTYTDVIYTGFRCGILHQAHVPLYGAISGQATIVSFLAKGITKYADKKSCPTVIVFPERLRIATEQAFAAYIDELLDADAQYDDLRQRFKEKFEDSFGVTISIAV